MNTLFDSEEYKGYYGNLNRYFSCIKTTMPDDFDWTSLSQIRLKEIVHPKYMIENFNKHIKEDVSLKISDKIKNDSDLSDLGLSSYGPVLLDTLIELTGKEATRTDYKTILAEQGTAAIFNVQSVLENDINMSIDILENCMK